MKMLKILNNLILRELLPLKSRITFKSNKLDQYNRVLAEVYDSKGVNINKKRIEEGMAVLYMQNQPECVDLLKAERAAKLNKVGVWSDSNFIPPYIYRKTTFKPIISG